MTDTTNAVGTQARSAVVTPNSTDPIALKTAERPDWTITEHGVATFAEVEQAIVTLAADDAVLAYRLQGFVAQSLTALSSQAEVMEALAVALVDRDAAVSGCPVNYSTPGNPHPGTGACSKCRACHSEPCGLSVTADHVMVGIFRTALSQYRTLGDRHDD